MLFLFILFFAGGFYDVGVWGEEVQGKGKFISLSLEAIKTVWVVSPLPFPPPPLR